MPWEDTCREARVGQEVTCACLGRMKGTRGCPGFLRQQSHKDKREVLSNGVSAGLNCSGALTAGSGRVKTITCS